ncbi:hypothetical protein [Legionella bononiensis]|uniref:Coiled-coil protein n=1 Tax=Legionella bononiensis TaxID=2793102 RepID=A0ABS1WFX8_9GAMM|nr:hypothetical protein [Legionella bononiensis]MBL7481724.1 hypothetical protein [Legionella bononiensis]MBL7528272.1 hypothetical protein [Legionella bononiensis]MBL7562747.1 hypothetical protein [Legionella bononiensis]
MILSPLRFNNSQSFYDFIIRLQNSGLVQIVTINGRQKIVRASLQNLESKFLKANDNNIYFLDDVLEFLHQETAESLSHSSIRFIDSQHKEVTLSQIKSDLTLCNELQGSKEPVLLMERMNPVLYSSSPFPSLDKLEDVLNAKTKYANAPFHDSVKGAKNRLGLILNISLVSKSLMTLTGNEIIPIPTPFQATELITHINKDLLKITIIEEIKLKLYLLNQIEQSTNLQKKAELTRWVDELDVNISNIKEIQHNLSEILTDQRDKIQKAKNKFLQIVHHDATLYTIHNKIRDLKNKIQVQEQDLQRLESNYKILKPLAVYGVMVGLPVLAVAAVIFVSGLLLPTMYFAMALAFISVILITLGLLSQTQLFTNKITDGLTQLQGSIEAKFDNTLEQKRSEINHLKSQVATLEIDVKFASDFVEVEPSLNLSLDNMSLLNNEIEADLQEIEQIEGKDGTQNKKKSDAKLFASNAGNISIFSRVSKSLPLPGRTPPSEHQLSRSNSNVELSM